MTITRRDFLIRAAGAGGASLMYEAMMGLGLLATPSQVPFDPSRSSTLAGRRIRLREARADFDGYVAELLSKALSQTQLDQPLTTEDRDRLLGYLRGLGNLNQQRQYRGSARRSGYDEASTPLPQRDLLGAGFDFYLGIDWDSQPAMMQVVGGMDRLPAALASRLGNRVVYRTSVRELRQSDRGVWAIYSDKDGRVRRADADYCVSTIPLPVLTGIPKDLSPPVASAIAAASYDGAGKIGLQFKRRFWETDDEIYGGRSWPNHEIGQLIYPSHGLHGRKGILVGYFLDFKRTVRERLPDERLGLALEQGARIHPQYATEFETAFSVSWPRVPWSRGSWRAETAAALKALAPLQQPDGRVYFAGDYMTSMSSWMQGASSQPVKWPWRSTHVRTRA
jgi:monoamine oxidase